jgi:hypothetical protein
MRTYDELKALIEKRGVHTVFGEPGEGWFIEQSAFELAHFLVAMQELGVQSVLEIGTGWRAGLARFLANEMGWRVVSMDKNQPVNPAPNVQFLMGRSEILRPLFDGQTFDLVIIDADHSYEAVKRDHELYAELAKKVVMFHDIAGLRDCEGVARYWAELVLARLDENLNSHSITDNDEEHRGGIGWYEVGETYIPIPEPTPVDPELLYFSNGIDSELDDAVHAPVPDYEEMTAPEPPKKTPRKRKPKAQ